MNDIGTESYLDICKNCIHSHPYENETEYLQCRRYPPVVVNDNEYGYFWDYPCVTPYLYCGEFDKKKEFWQNDYDW